LTLAQLASETKLSVELWAGLEESNLGRWPKRIFARSYVRDYALRVGLDADEVVNEFCRLFPEWGDRRAEPVIREKAEIIAHDLDWEDLPSREERRAHARAAQVAPGLAARHRERMMAVAIDLNIAFWGAWVAVHLRFDFWPALAVASLLYSVLSTALTGRSFGVVAAGWLVRVVRALPSTRRLVSSRAQSA
jgi:hypothetical protein